MLELKDVSIAIDDKVIIAHLNMTLQASDKVAIIGEEGNGKSTLLKAIMGIASYATLQGSIYFQNYKIAYLKQSLSDNEQQQKVFSFVFKDEEEYYEKITSMYSIFSMLSLNDDILEKDVCILSGGEKVKVQLLKLLLDEPDILLLDEPTNDLDIPTLEWLENFINTCDKPIMFVSHDEKLLSCTANRILHLELRKKKQEPFHTLESISYDEYIQKRLHTLSKQTQVAYSEKREHQKKVDKLNRQMQQVNYQLNTVSRQNPHMGQLLKKKMRNVKAHEKRIDNEVISDVPDVEESIHLFFNDVCIASRKQIISLHMDCLCVQSNTLARNIDFEVYGSAHVVIIGKNGVGKTTLLKHMYSLLKDRKDIHVGYMPQEYDTILNNVNTAIDFLCVDKNSEALTTARKHLGNLNFTRAEMIAPISSLSGGSKAKLILLKLILNNYDVLLLDEPTRNVSPLSNPIIRKALREYKGCIISISHDRKYIEEVCDEVYELTSTGIKKH